MVGSRVYVGGLPRDTRERDLERFFKGYGRLCDIMIKNGYAFVEFEDHRDADDAVYELDGKDLLGERVSVEQARGKPRGGDVRRGGRSEKVRGGFRYGPPRRSKYRVIVKNVSSSVSWQDLKDYLRKAGEVIYADTHRPRRNEGIVEFETRRDMEKAIDKMDDTELNGRRIRLIEDDGGRNKCGRSRSLDSRSRSRSRRRSRSRSDSSYRTRSESRSRSVSPKKPRYERQKRYRDESRSRSRSLNGDAKKYCSRSRSKSERRSRSRSNSKDNESRSRSRSSVHLKESKNGTLRHHSRSRSSNPDTISSSRDQKQSKDTARSRSRSKSERRSNSRSKSRDNKGRSRPKSYSGSRSRSASRSNSGSRTRSVSRDDKNRSCSQGTYNV
ncbi:serine/arginine-rich splicing factor 5-like [Toxorhynchites rutilus septentrionalis]|uniref:serine/arginine-rich splicing factor 5-like n=1 Tax=Toxorhynchites rutilus septentrionalis TaxID=329112 RepID=UPI0024799ADB|nr:serine/arginine-rich splicing factor 5-like [Toxorhynchites rutilus septentrionalis]